MNCSTSKNLCSSILRTPGIIVIMFFLIPLGKSQHNSNSLVYIKCTNQTRKDSASLSSLFQQLLPQSAHSNFFKATVGGGQFTGISGRYQCRGNLRSQNECQDCINTLPQHYATCGRSVGGRIELNGCYFEYETDEFMAEETGSKNEVNHEICSEEKGDIVGFVEVRDAAMLVMEEGLVSDEKGYYEMDYENIHVIGECENGLIGCDCSQCLGFASQIAQQDCGSSIWGKIYLDQCFLSYALNLHPEKRESKGGNGEKVAIVLGAATALAGAFIFLKCIGSKCNNKDDE